MKLRKTYVRLMALTLLAIGIYVFMPARASALTLNPNPGPGQLPVNVRQSLETCDQRTQSPGFEQWVSQRGAPTATMIDVPYGATSIDLDFHFAGVVCRTNNDVSRSSIRTMDARTYSPNIYFIPSGNVSDIVTNIMHLEFGAGWHTIGTYRHAVRSFRYNMPEGFRVPGLYTIELDNRVINQFSSRYGCVANGGGTIPRFEFELCPRDPPQFRIFLRVGDPPPAAAPFTTECGGITVTPGSPEPGQTFTVNVGYRTRTTGAGVDQQALHTVFFSLPAAGVNNQVVEYQEYIGRNESRSPPVPNLSIPNPGRYNGSYRVLVAGSNPSEITCNFGVGQPDGPPVDIVSKPYFKTYGGDILAGVGFRDGASCRTDPDAVVLGASSRPVRTGAGTQLALLALGVVYDFGSGVNRDPDDRKHLTFANDDASIYGGNLAGNYETDPPCAPNYYARVSGNISGSSTASPSVTAGQVVVNQYNNDVNIPAGTLEAGGRRTIYVRGNAFITGNIVYRGTNPDATNPNPTYASRHDIPVFRLIVQGNIYVAPNVTRLDGIYVAQPGSGGNPQNGRFYTCARREWSGVPGAPYVPTEDQVMNECRTNRLTVYGSVTSEILKLTRSPGTQLQSVSNEHYTNSAGSPAEVFVMTPEVWLGGGLSAGSEFDSVTALPPIL